MASPFRYFRKHQKVFMAAAAVIAIFVFVIGDALFSYIGQAGGGRRSPKTTVASWKGGSLSVQEIESLTQRRYFISEFLQRLRAVGAQQIISEGGNPMLPPVPDFVLPDNYGNQRTQMSVVETRILAEQAKKTGITVSDDVINHFLRETGFRRVSNQQIVEILNSTRQGSPQQVEDQLFAGLRELLLEDYYFRGYSAAIRNVMPQDRWEDWWRVNHRIAVEAALVPTEEFVGEVPDPTDEQLLAFYEKYKDFEADSPEFVQGKELPSPEPGFREPRRVRLEYLLGDVNALAQEYLDEITDEEIAAYYEENKETEFVKTGSSIDTDSYDELFGEFEDEPTSTEASAEATDTSEADDIADSEESPAEPEDDPATAEEDDAEEGSASEQGSANNEEQSEADASSDDSAEEDNSDDPAPEDTGSLGHQAAFRLVAFQDNEAESADNDAVESETEAVDTDNETENDSSDDTAETSRPDTVSANDDAGAESDSSTVSESEGAEETRAEKSREDDSPGEETSDFAESATVSSDTASVNADDEGFDEVATVEGEEQPLEFAPLDSVRDSIRLKLATDKAAAELKKQMDRTYAELQTEYNPYGFEVVSARSEDREPPAPPEGLTNLEARAKETGLLSEETVLLTQRELADTFVGKAIDAQTGRQYVVQAVFSDLEVYEPFLAQDLDDNWYLVMKVEDEPSRVPPFEEVRGDVLTAWKRSQAAELAINRAKELAKEAEESGGTLADVLANTDYEVLTTDLFSWLSFGSTPVEMQRGPRLGDAPPLEAVGPDFMKKAFELEDDDVSAVLNHDHSTAYVIRLDGRERSKQELRELFLSEANNWYGGQVMTAVRWQNNQQQLMEHLTEEVGLDVEQLEEYFNPPREE